MTRILLLALCLLLGACSSADHSSEDYTQGRYRFSLLFHKEFQRFLKTHILADGMTTYAGPHFTSFHNYQKINVYRLRASNQMENTIHLAKDGTQHAYTHYQMNESYSKPGHYYLDLELDGEYLGYVASTKIRVQVKITCKKELKCEPGLAIPALAHDTPFDFEWEIMDKDYVTNKKPNLKEFNDFEQMAIHQRLPYRGMSEAAFRRALGSPERPAGYFMNIRLEDGTLKDFNVRDDYARLFYSFY